MFVTGLTCFACSRKYEAGQLLKLCECGKPLRVDYDLAAAARTLTIASLAGRRKDLWRYREVLPLPEGSSIPTLGEGGTPLTSADRLAREIGMGDGRLFVKDESLNPTGSFKARGMAAAVAMAAHLGVRRLAVPSAGNAGGALAAYAALHGLDATVVMPRDVPQANILECEIAGARVELVDGLIHDCAAFIGERKEREGWFDVSTLKEPYRIEGKKTMGFEIAEQLDWRLPDVILYPTGGGTGLIGMWKAFAEMEALGWIGPARPRMVSVQAEGCAPIARAFGEGRHYADLFENASTVAAGLRVPKAIGDFVMLDLLRESRGTAVAVPDADLIRDARALGAATGITACPEAGACLAALRRLLTAGWVQPEDRVVLFNTGTGAKYLEAFRAFR